MCFPLSSLDVRSVRTFRFFSRHGRKINQCIFNECLLFWSTTIDVAASFLIAWRERFNGRERRHDKALNNDRAIVRSGLKELWMNESLNKEVLLSFLTVNFTSFLFVPITDRKLQQRLRKEWSHHSIQNAQEPIAILYEDFLARRKPNISDQKPFFLSFRQRETRLQRKGLCGITSLLKRCISALTKACCESQGKQGKWRTGKKKFCTHSA